MRVFYLFFPDSNDRLRGCNGSSDSLTGSSYYCSFQGSSHGCRTNMVNTSGRYWGFHWCFHDPSNDLTE